MHLLLFCDNGITMPIDEDIRAYLKLMEGAPSPSQQPAAIGQIREATHQFWLERQQTAEKAPTQNLQIPGRDGAVNARLYRPEDAGEQPPMIVFAHGGGFVFGGLDTHDEICHRLSLESGTAVLSVDYRLAPEHPFPAAVHDVIDVLGWVFSNADSLKIDASRIFVAGDSAGGNLAAAAAQHARDHGWPLHGQALIYPVTDLRDGDYESRRTRAAGFGLSEVDMKWYRKLYLPDESRADDPSGSPIANPELSGLAPTFVMTAGYDPLCSEGVEYARLLKIADVEVEHLHLSGANHGVFSNWTLFRAGESTWQALLYWLAARLNGS